MPDKPQGRPTRLRITSCASVYQGTNKRGDAYEIHEITATKEDGTPVDQKLRSFEMLPVGEVLDLTVTPFPSEKHGMSYTLARKDRPSRTSELATKLTELTARVEKIEAHLRSGAKPAGATTQQAVAEVQADLDERFGAS